MAVGSVRTRSLLGVLAVLAAGCGGESAGSSTIGTETPVVTAPAAAAAGWAEVDLKNLPVPYAGRWWAVSGCCLSGYAATEGSPSFGSDGSLADGHYVATLISFDPERADSVGLLVSRLEDCVNLPNTEECGGVTEPGQHFEPTSIGARDIEVALDDNLLVTVFSHAENPTTGEGVQLRTMSGNGLDLRDLLLAVDADYDTYVTPLVDDGVGVDEISASLEAADGPFALTTLVDQDYGMVRWWREGFPPLSYWQGAKGTAGILTPGVFDPTTNDFRTATYDEFIRRSGALDVQNGVMSFSYGWMAIGG